MEILVSTEKHEGDAVCLVYNNKKIYSGGADGKIKIWNHNLDLLKTLDTHESYIYAISVDKNGKLYSSSCDGAVKFMNVNQEIVYELMRCDDTIQAIYYDNDIVYTADDKGVVTSWKDDKIIFKYNLIEEVKSLAVEGTTIYTARHLDVVVSEIIPGKSGKYFIKSVIAGRAPLALLGPISENKRSYLAFTDRTGKGLELVNNLPKQKFRNIWTLPDCHEMIICAIVGNEKFLFSGGYDGKVKGWTDLEKQQPIAIGELNVGSCVNSLCCDENGFVYIAASDGFIRRGKYF